MTRTHRIAGHRKNIILNARSLRVLRWIGEQEAVTYDHISQLLGTLSTRATKEIGILSASATTQVLSNWLELGLIEQRKIIAMTPPWVWLTTHGLRELGFDFNFSSPRLSELPHIHAINFIRLLTEQQTVDAQWISQRHLQAEQPKRTRGLDLPHLPDALVLRENARYAIEIELTAKSQIRLASILQELVLSYDLVFYYASAEAAHAVRTALLNLSEAEQKQVRIALLGEEYGYSIIRV